MNPLRILAMLKFPPDLDQFKHFRADPPEIKLEAWKQLQRRLAVRDLAWCATAISSLAIALLLIASRFRIG
jgi:hypothetical protein